MTPGEHYAAAEALGEEALKFKGALYHCTTSKASGDNRKALPLSVINYVQFLQKQAQYHALMAAAPEPRVLAVADPYYPADYRGGVHD